MLLFRDSSRKVFPNGVRNNLMVRLFGDLSSSHYVVVINRVDLHTSLFLLLSLVIDNS